MKPKSGAAASKMIRIEGVGEVLLERSRRARHICLSIRPFKGVRVAVPYGVPFERAEAVAQARSAWIEKHLRRMAKVEQDAVTYDQRIPVNRSVARRVIADRLQELARLHGFTFGRIFIRNQKSRWGSCSAQNNINLNVHLVLLPPALRDYVILHELVHTRVKHHGPQFWAALERYVPDCRQVDKELNRYESMLAAPAPLGH
jgi:predicted metal-dependent hydrolase